MGDDGVAVRVMGRVRPLLGEIALLGKKPDSGSRKLPTRGRTEFVEDGPKPWIRVATQPPATASTRRGAKKPLSSIIDWIEGDANEALLRQALVDRKRVVLMDAVQHNASPGHVQHWRLEPRRKSRLSLVRFYQRSQDESFDHLPFWLEEDMPEHGTDLIAIEPYRVEPGSDLSPVLRSRLAAITSQVGGLLLRILEEEGWNSRPKPRRRTPPRVA